MGDIARVSGATYKDLWGGKVKVRVCFFADSYRKNPPFETTYRPHIVIKETTEYLGIQFLNLDEMPLGEEFLSDIKLLYDGIDYSALIVGTVFEIKEGAHVVGEGVVISS